MTNCKSNNNSSVKPVVLNFQGFDKNMAKATNTKNRMASIKEKISASILSNINYEKSGTQLSASMRMLSDTDTHTVVTLRCGAYKVLQNTVLKSEYNHIEILEGLQYMLDKGQFDEQITAYMNRKFKKSSSKSEKAKIAE